MTNPDSALELHEQVIAVATAGDFSRVTTPQSAQTVFAINKLASAALADGEDEYESLLPIVGELLRHPNRFEEFWHDDWQRLRSDFEQIDKGDVRITEYPEIDLSVIESPRPIDAMAICSRTDCLRYLTISGDRFYKFQYRYESWVQVVSHTVRPRIDLHSLSTRLQQLESAQGSWKYGDTSDIMPSLEFVDFERNPTPSAIPRAQLIPEVIGFFEREQDNQSLQWSPYDTEEAGGCGIVFEQSEPQQPSTALHQLGRLNKRNAD